MTELLAALQIFVAPNGQDANPGTREKPVATLFRAQGLAREAVRSHKRPVEVILRGGTYYLEKPLLLTAADSGTASAHVVYTAFKQEKPILHAGKRLTLQWTPYRNGILQAKLPSPLPFAFDAFFVNGQRQIMARYPNFDPHASHYNGFAEDTYAPERVRTWNDPSGGFVHAIHAYEWGSMDFKILGKTDDGKLRWEGGWQNNRRNDPHPKYRYVENIFEELDAPGEWFFRASDSTLFYYPPAELDIAHAVFEAGGNEEIVRFDGTAAAPVRFIGLKGLILTGTARTFMQTKEPLLRSDWTIHRGGAVFLTGTEDCFVQDCFLHEVGGNGIFVSNYNRRAAIRGCHLTEVGASGVAFVGDPNAVRSPLFEYNESMPIEQVDRIPGPKSDNYPADCTVSDCLITRVGRTEKQGAAVEIAMAQSITVEHCSIYDLPRAGINIGDGCWGGHLIQHCDIFDTVQETGDHGSFNSWGRDRYWHPDIATVNRQVAKEPELPLLDVIKPITLRHNRWRCDHGWDIDLDDGSSNYIIEDNLCLHGGLKNREGYRRTVRNNILVGNTFHPHVWFDNSHDIFEHNIVGTPYAPIGMPTKWGERIDNNIFLTEEALQKAQVSGHDAHSKTVPIAFRDPARLDFTVPADSPALASGFRNFPMDGFGVIRPELRRIARTPLPPGQTSPAKTMDDTIVAWWGAEVKTVTTLGERSAVGLPEAAGVLLLNVPEGSIAARNGIQKMDVILSLGEESVRNIADLIRIAGKHQTGEKLTIVLFRHQKELPLTLTIIKQ